MAKNKKYKKSSNRINRKNKRGKIIRSSLEVHLDLYVSEEIYTEVKDVMFDEIAITSSFKLEIINKSSKGFSIEDLPNIIVKASKVSGEKCQRCWKYQNKLINNEICERCNDAIN